MSSISAAKVVINANTTITGGEAANLEVTKLEVPNGGTIQTDKLTVDGKLNKLGDLAVEGDLKSNYTFAVHTNKDAKNDAGYATKIYLGRGYSLETTSDGRLAVVDFEDAKVATFAMAADDAPETLTANTANVIDLFADIDNDFTKISGAHDHTYDSNTNTLTMLGSPLNTWNSAYDSTMTANNVNTFLATVASYNNFTLQVEAKGENNNGGIQIGWASPLSQKPELSQFRGVQAEVHGGAFGPSSDAGELYGEGWASVGGDSSTNGRAQLTFGEQFRTQEESAALFPAGEWHTYKIVRRDWVTKVWVDDHMTAKYYEDVQDNNDVARKEGQIGFQCHVGDATEGGMATGNMYYRNALLLLDPQ